MNMKHKALLPALGLAILVCPGKQSLLAGTPGKTNWVAIRDTTQSLAPYFTPATTSKKTPNAEGFIQRWLLLEPINKPNRSNVVFTDSYLRTAFTTQYFPGQFTTIPKNWHGTP
jgi:hypothetical protein